MSPILLVISIIALLCFALLVFAVVRAIGRRRPRKGKALTQWAKQVKFSSHQLAAMRTLWHWHISGKQPSGDPLKLLSTAEMADLLQKCALEYLPEQFREVDEDKARQALIERLRGQGMDELQAQIVVGMMYGKFGPGSEGRS